MQPDVIIIGAGAAGLMAAYSAGQDSKKALIFNKHKQAGKKIAITGKGRCNVTNNCDVDEFLKNVPTNPKFLYSALSSFTPADTMELFESLGVPLKTERGRRVFPQSDNAHDIADTLVKAAKALGARLIDEKVTDMIIENSEIKGVVTKSGEYLCNKVIIATGGLSYPATGSDGDGYKLAEKAGHTVTKLSPSLSALVSDDKYCAQMMGLSLKNVQVTLFEHNGNKKKKKYCELGEMLFTHFGVSGPLILSASAHIYDISKYAYSIEIDLKPALDESRLDARILRDFSEAKNKDFTNSLSKLIPSKMIPVVVSLSKIPPDKKVNLITKEERAGLVRLLKHFPVNICGYRPIEEAIITRGGISLSQINPKTMESKLCKGLFFAGEILDVDAYTGGYNLQIAFSTGFTAGKNV